MTRTRLPLVARLLVRLSPIARDEREAVRADLEELFIRRRASHGAWQAHSRLYHDIASFWRFPLLGDARIDLKHAGRLFARQPAILAMTTLGLSVGLGIATAAFSIMNAAILRGEGLADSDRTPAVLFATSRHTATEWSYDDFQRLRAGATRMQVEGVATDAVQISVAPGAGDGVRARIAFVSGGFFEATGAGVSTGRGLGPADDTSQRDGNPAVVISDMFWKRRLHADPHVIGTTIRIGRTDATIVGIAAKGVTVPSTRELWMPLAAFAPVFGVTETRAREIAGVQVFGRLHPGVSLGDAGAQLNGVAASLPVKGEQAGVRLDPHAGLGRMSRSETLPLVAFAFAVVGLLLLLACANVATVLVSTAITREREMAVRAALGGSRRRILRQLVTESLALGVISAVFGLMFAYWAIPIAGRMIEAPAGSDLSPDLNVLLFLGAVTIVTGVVAGLAPARHGRGADLISPLKGEVRQERVRPRRLRSLLVMTQAAASVLLIVLSALFVRASFHMAAVDVGFDTSNLYGVSAALGYGSDDASARAFWTRAIAEIESVPGVNSVAVAELPPFSGGTRTALTRDEPARRVFIHRTGAKYFETMRMRTLAGRTFTADEAAGGVPVALVSESLARLYWPGRSPLGEVLPASIPLPTTRPIVIGVVGDAITARIDRGDRLAIYEPFPSADVGVTRLVMRVEPGASSALDQVGRRLRAIDPNAGVFIDDIGAAVKEEAGRPRMLATLTGTIGVVAILMCIVGLYGITASVVGQRTRELGVRVALGAKPADLLRMLMWDSLRPVVIGLAVGAGLAVLAGRVVIAAIFFGVSPNDPLALAGAITTLLAVAMIAVLLPARRAVEIDPAVVLKR